MSNPQSKMVGVKFEPVPKRGIRPPGEWLLVLGVIYPAGVILFELATQMCAKAFFAPPPTAFAARPLSNLPIPRSSAVDVPSPQAALNSEMNTAAPRRRRS